MAIRIKGLISENNGGAAISIGSADGIKIAESGNGVKITDLTVGNFNYGKCKMCGNEAGAILNGVPYCKVHLDVAMKSCNRQT